MPISCVLFYVVGAFLGICQFVSSVKTFGSTNKLRPLFSFNFWSGYDFVLLIESYLFKIILSHEVSIAVEILIWGQKHMYFCFTTGNLLQRTLLDIIHVHL